MPDLRSRFHELGALDQLSRLDTPLRGIDPRAMLLTVALFVLVTVSFGKYEISALLPLLFFPLALASLGRV